jgi:hypothetical protein
VVHHLGITSVVHLLISLAENRRTSFAPTRGRVLRIRETFRSIESLQRVDGETRLDMLLQIVQLGDVRRAGCCGVGAMRAMSGR